jgi:hypothetical protein
MFMYTRCAQGCGMLGLRYVPSTEELEGVNPDKVEQRMCATGWDFIEAHTEQSASQP